ncbi:unnamed protein product [Soboliphyme baturini]|uniref:WD_REPEATS_REGION domain-containing protein n=1 Tax=Soboliphyme baturini TaxID=241478 RepID=A0A183J5I4_9BILA|nr:unnamed protein product [Soboliphyme baturini]
MALYDLRFQLKVMEFKHSHSVFLLDRFVHRIYPHPQQSSRIFSSFCGNGELSEWDMETGTRQCVFWPAATPPLSYHEVTHGDFT